MTTITPPRARPAAHARRAFTLTELLVAVALSSAVAAIGFIGVQTFGKAMLRARQLSGETQLITAALLYTVSDADGMTTFAPGSFVSVPAGWPAVVPTATQDVTATRTINRLHLDFTSNPSGARNPVDYVGRTHNTSGSPYVYGVSFATFPKR